jgi:transcriptional regulator with GAF, ATPase, and Fis domain
MSNVLWCHFFLNGGPAEGRAYVEALMAGGMNAVTFGGGGARAPGIVFFDEFSKDLSEFVREISRNGLDRVLAIALTGAGLAAGAAWRLLGAGASDVFAWDHWRSPAQEVADRFARWDKIDQLVESPLVRDNLVGESPAWKGVLRKLVEVARFTDASVLITGESGTGKELAARLMHTLDARPDKRELVVLDCTTIVPELSGSEFFGHERGSYTGAVNARDGAFALADGGTLFLDEVGELSLRLQSELLRVVQEHTYKRVGSHTWQQTNFRLACATNRDLQREEARGRFRSDFYHRLASWSCQLPPLRERPGDLPLLVQHFLKKLSRNGEPPELDDAVRDYLYCRDYPGNVRELKQVVTRIFNRHVGEGPVTAGEIPEEERPGQDCGCEELCDPLFEQAARRALSLGIKLKEITSRSSDAAIRIAVSDAGGNLQRAAQRLGVTDRALQLRRAERQKGKD